MHQALYLIVSRLEPDTMYLSVLSVCLLFPLWVHAALAVFNILYYLMCVLRLGVGGGSLHAFFSLINTM